MEIINTILSLNDQELSEYVQKRLFELESAADNTRKKLPSIQKGFITSNIEIKSFENDIIGYCMKGIDYLEFVKKTIKNNQQNDIISIIVKVINYVRYYFDFNPYREYRGDTRSQILVETAMKETGVNDQFDLFDVDYMPSINCLKNVEQAVCLEHAVLLQNLLSFLGIDTICFNMYSLENDGIIKGHVANIVDMKFGDTIKHLYCDLVDLEIMKDGEELIVKPTLKQISEDTYQKFISGEEPLCIKRADYRIDSGYSEKYYLPISNKNIIRLQLGKK